MLRFLLCTICLLIPLTAQATLYKVVDDEGNITYTDTAPELGAAEHKLGSINAVGNPAFNAGKLSMSIPFTEENGVKVVRGTVNGIAMRFIVDTGASLLAIPPSIAKQAGLLDIPSQEITVHTANGSVQAQKVTIEKLTVSKVEQTQIQATIQSISPTDPTLGLLGMSFFNKYKLTIDDQKKEIQLEIK